MEYLLALTLSALFTLVFIFFKRKNSNVYKPKALKKEELVESYKAELLAILEEYKNDSNLQRVEKIKFLKKVNYELSMNIFFDEKEAKDLLQELSRLEK
ncbi:hypothetical protein [Arcobacter aquimarinus]|uniref:Uncharacterized protein n=1 Tax=Arcobacter aquimarinus TaxID=1315211 RepID=A0AAE7E2A7_9BACT|nr:hypothetical protein [Arcobacter aquimarinus]QKE26411.1 hypothetical protein AAQM_1668 [Arcobacter aquimarinus]RXI34502.1 hypothetical protein CP986_09105 [Arcobacter aquimarinus]